MISKESSFRIRNSATLRTFSGLIVGFGESGKGDVLGKFSLVLAHLLHGAAPKVAAALHYGLGVCSLGTPMRAACG
jgi:hypothetical protein